MQVKEAIFSRRSVRSFTDQPVGKDSINHLLEAATQAPSAMNVQPWTFVVIQDRALLERYSDRAKIIFAETHRKKLHPEMEKMLADPDFNIFHDAGTVIVICTRPEGEHPDWDCCFAAQNLMLTAHAMGLGTCVIEMAWPIFERADVKRELKIPAEYRIVLPIALGFPSQPGRPAVYKKEPVILDWKTSAELD